MGVSMLLRFSVGNVLSFNEKVSFSMIPSLQKSNNSNLISLGSVNVLRFGVVYGANASGKSNFIKAFHLGLRIISKGISNRVVNDYCKISESNKSNVSIFEYTFFSEGSFFSYGFSCILSQKRIVDEWLYTINPANDTEKVLFLRENENVNGKSVFQIQLTTEDLSRVNTYLLDMKEKHHLLLLGQLKDKKFDSNSNLKIIESVVSWLKNIDVTYPDEPINNLEVLHEDNCERISRILSSFDTGISKIYFEKITLDELQHRIRQTELIQEIREMFIERFEKHPGKLGMLLRGKDEFYKIEGTSIEELEVSVLRLNHHNSETVFEFSDESDGTRRMFDLLDILLTDRDNVVFVIDEIERSLHPVLLYKFFEMMKNEFVGKNIQIIVTTHETHILDQSLLRRDEVWFVEKEETGASKLYSLDVFKERIDKNLSKNYLNGNYGGIPLFDKMER